MAFNLSFNLWPHIAYTCFGGCTRGPSRALTATRLRLKNHNLKPTAIITKSMARIIGPNATSFIAVCSNWVRHYCPLNSRYKFMHWSCYNHSIVMHYFMSIYNVFMHTLYYWYVLLELGIGPEWMQQQNKIYLIK